MKKTHYFVAGNTQRQLLSF